MAQQAADTVDTSVGIADTDDMPADTVDLDDMPADIVGSYFAESVAVETDPIAESAVERALAYFLVEPAAVPTVSALALQEIRTTDKTSILRPNQTRN